MSWLFSQVLVGEYLGDICSDGEQSVQSNGNHIQQAYCLPDKMTEYSRLSRFGMMFKPLTETLGEELLMSYRADFHAKTSPFPTQVEKDLTEKGLECGERWHGLFARYDPSTHSLKTVQCSLLEDSEQSLQTWPRWGSMQNGVCYQQPMLVQTTSEKECGLLQNRKWATPDANMGKRGYQKPENLHKTTHQITVNDLAMYRYGMKKLSPILCEWIMGWPLGWTDLKPLEMDKSHYVQQQHGTFLKED